jgi:hypothetical protein
MILKCWRAAIKSSLLFIFKKDQCIAALEKEYRADSRMAIHLEGGSGGADP